MIELFSYDDDDEEDDDNYDDEHLSHVDLVEHPDQCDPHPIETGSYFVFQPPDIVISSFMVIMILMMILTMIVMTMMVTLSRYCCC